MPTVDHAAEVAKQISELMEPLRKQDRAIEQELAELSQQREQLRAVQTKVRAMIRAYDPDYRKRSVSRNGSKGKPGISDARITLLGEWLVANAEKVNALTEDGFYSTELERHHGAELKMAQTQISKALIALQERGVIRLTAINKGSGGRKTYKVVV